MAARRPTVARVPRAPKAKGDKIIIVNGRKFPGSFEDAEKQGVKHLCYTKEGIESNRVYGFKDDNALLTWARRHGLHESVKKAFEDDKRMKKQYKKEPTKAEEESIRKNQVARINLHNERFSKLLTKHRIKPNQIDRIAKLKTEYDPIREEPIGTCIIYDRRNYVGDWRFFPLGWFPKLSWYGFNDRTESILQILGLTILYQHTWFNWFVWGGAQRWYFWSDNDLGWFNNRASSAKVF